MSQRNMLYDGRYAREDVLKLRPIDWPPLKPKLNDVWGALEANDTLGIQKF